MKKYELTDETNGSGLFRIRALREISSFGVNAGDLGGFIESEKNLNHNGNCWVFGDAWVFGNAKVFGDARVLDNVRVSDDARVSGDAWVSGDARVSGDAWVFGDARVSGDAKIENESDVVCISNVGSENGTLTMFKTTTGIGVTRGCFRGSYNEFIEKVKKHHGDNDHGRFYLEIAQLLHNKIISGF